MFLSSSALHSSCRIKILLISLVLIGLLGMGTAQDLSPALKELLDQGITSYEKGDYEKASELFLNLEEQARASEDDKVLGNCYYQLGEFYQKQQSFKRSLKLFIASTELLESQFATNRSNIIVSPLEKSPETFNLSAPKDVGLICEVYNKVGGLYFRQGNYNKARRYWRKSYREALEHNSAKALSNAYNNLGELERIKGNADTALLYYKSALRIKAYIRDSTGLHVNLTNIGHVFLKRQQLDSAKLYYDRAYAIAQQLSLPQLLVTSSLNYGIYYNTAQQFQQALPWLTQALEKAEELDDQTAQAAAHKQLAQLYERQGKLGATLLHQKEWASLKRTLIKSNQAKLTMQIEAEYLMHEKEKQLLEARQVAQLVREQNRRMDLMQWGGLLLALVLLFATVLVLRLRRRHEAMLTTYCQHIEQQNKEKSILLREIHHRVKNNLQVITSLLGLQSLSIEDPQSKDFFLQSQRRINSMSMIHQMLYQSDQLASINYRNYLQQLIQELIASLRGQEAKLQVNMDVPEVSINIDTAIPLGLIVNEIVTNALKYGLNKGADSILSLRLIPLEEGRFQLEIGDNGNGISGDWTKASSNASLGMRLIQQLSRQLDGVIERDHSKSGMNYILTFKEIKHHE